MRPRSAPCACRGTDDRGSAAVANGRLSGAWLLLVGTQNPEILRPDLPNFNPFVRLAARRGVDPGCSRPARACVVCCDRAAISASQLMAAFVRDNGKAPRLRGFRLIGAPRFELGTSSPPD